MTNELPAQSNDANAGSHGYGLMATKTLSEIKRIVSDIEPPFPQELIETLKEDQRAGARQLVKSLLSKQRAKKRADDRVERMLEHERRARADGFAVIAGVDEVGRGPLAGPVVASAVILPPDMAFAEINDSKSLTDTQRRKTLELIVATCEIGVGVVSVAEIDRVNIYKANQLAMRLAVEDLGRPVDLLLVDGRPARGLGAPQRAIVKGDKASMSIAAASIVAKVVRDQMMLEFDKMYPQYKFAQHKGYGTAEHIEMIKEFGVCPIHRRSFAPVKERLEGRLL